MSDGARPGPPAIIAFTVNGRAVRVRAPPIRRLAAVLRDDLGLTGTKIGCNAGDCGACTVLVDGAQRCACLVPLGQVGGCSVTTVEGLAEGGTLDTLQAAFHRHGAAQCGICTPGMLMAAHDLLSRDPHPSPAAVTDALAGVLCRCTGYRKIVNAVLAAAGVPVDLPPPSPDGPGAVGARVGKVDGPAKLTGEERFGADAIPADALWLRVLRSPHAAARFTLGDPSALLARPGVVRVLTAADVPHNGFGIFPHLRDQPVLAAGVVRYRGEAVAAVLGERAAIEALRDDDLPISYDPSAPVIGIDAARSKEAPRVQAARADNLLIEGRLVSGDAIAALANCAAVADGCFTTASVEHAYIEPEAGWARRVDGRIELHVSTQSPYLDRDETAHVLQIPRAAVRILPTACGGGFGGKLDLSVQPLLALAATLVERPVALVYERPESMAASTKRHPARITARMGADASGHLVAFTAEADFDTGAYASWGPTVAGRVPVHAAGPYRVPHVHTHSRAWLTNAPPSGAFRGFGVPQAAIAHEALLDDLAARLDLDRLAIRRQNALRVGDVTATGQTLAASAGLVACLDAVEPRWRAMLAAARTTNHETADRRAPNHRVDHRRQGVGIGCMWYGIGNTGMPHPSTMRIGLSAAGRVTLYSGAVDIGQGANTILAQIAADGLGVPVSAIAVVMGDTDRTADAGKTSASRQTFVSGKAAELAARDLRAAILRRVNAGAEALLLLRGAVVEIRDRGRCHRLDLGQLAADAEGDVLVGEGHFDPPAPPLDADGQGAPYATYGFAAQIARVEVDLELGTTKVLEIVAAHDVGRAINPTQVEGQIEGGIAQGLGMALMEEYLPGRTENLHDYLIPTAGDIPPIEVILIEDPEPLGPFGAKGVGEPGLVATAPAILGAIRHATGVRCTGVPVLPHRLRAALCARSGPD